MITPRNWFQQPESSIDWESYIPTSSAERIIMGKKNSYLLVPVFLDNRIHGTREQKIRLQIYNHSMEEREEPRYFDTMDQAIEWCGFIDSLPDCISSVQNAINDVDKGTIIYSMDMTYMSIKELSLFVNRVMDDLKQRNINPSKAKVIACDTKSDTKRFQICIKDDKKFVRASIINK